MNVFSDLHHETLYHSLIMLFEKRLGMNLYRPIGLEWFDQGYWKINNQMSTAHQYLSLGSSPEDGTIPLNNNLSEKIGKAYQIPDYHNHSIQKAITLDTFKETKFDLLIASIPAHIKPFKELIRLYQPQAKLIFQMGNMFNEVLENPNEIPNLLASTVEFPFSNNAVFYHQEFDLDVFKPSEEPPEKLISSFINVYQENLGFQNFTQLMALMPEIEFKSFGGQCINGTVNGVENMASIMQRSMFGLHVKAGADGYGHSIHNFFAVGTPVIINYSEYKDKLAGQLTIPDETCIIADINDDMYAVAEKIRNIPPIQYEWMRQRTRQRFEEIINFDEEEQKIRKFLEVLH